MRLSCELVVTEVLPTARRELARELVLIHGFSQTDVAEMFGITGSAVSQYMKGVRGHNDLIFRTSSGDAFTELVSECAAVLAEGRSDPVAELCRICSFSKDSGMLDEMNGLSGMEVPYGRCLECPNTGLCGEVLLRK